MGIIYIIFDEGGGGNNVAANSEITVNIELKKIPIFYQNAIYDDVTDGLPESGVSSRVSTISFSNKGIRIKTPSQITSSSRHKIIFIRFIGNFNFDNISVNEFTRRVEVRNEEMVLIADNGLPWGDGTYPPDAKNRAGLAGLHAAVINPELDAALTGDVTNKEAELTGSERGAGVQYALDKDDNNGL